MRHVLFLSLLVLGALAAACGGNTAVPPSNPTNAPVRATLAPLPTQVPVEATTDVPAPTAVVAQPTTVAPTTAPSGGSVNPQTPSGAPLDVVKTASLKVFDAKSVRASTLVEPADGNKVTLILEYVQPDRIHVVQTDPTGQSVERIAIKDKGFWTKTGDIWQAEGADAAKLFFALLSSDALEESFKVIQVDSIQFEGAEQLDGKPVFVYTYKTVVDYGGQKANGIGKLWVGAVDGRAYKGESTSESLALPGKQDHTVVTYEYDIPITIEAPQ